MAMDAERRSSVSISITMPETENRQRPPSKGIFDLFRRRRKSGSNLMLANILVNDADVDIPTTTMKNKSNKARQRSSSVQVGQSSPLSIPSSNNSAEPLRIALAKKELGNRLSLSPPDHGTPMSGLLSSSLGYDEGMQLFAKKVGPSEFMEMYRNRRCSLDLGSSESLSKLGMRKKSDSKPPLSPLARENLSPAKKLSGLFEMKFDSSPRLLKSPLDHVFHSAGTKTRRLSVFSPPSDRCEEGRTKQLGIIPSRRRRFSEPQGPKLEVLQKLSGAQSKVFQSENVSDAMSNFPKFTPNIPKSSISTASLGNCLGRHIPLEPAHYVIWKEGKKIEKILKLPCTEEEYLEPIEDLVPDENQVFVKFLKSHRCYELMPASAKLVILDKELKVTHAFDALTFNGIRSAPVWDSESCEYIGMLTVTDFIQILKRHHHSKDELNDVCSQKISEWRELLAEDLKPMVTISSVTSLYEAMQRLQQNNIHRLLVVDELTNEALYILTNRRVIHFVWYFFQIFHLSVPDFMNKSVKELDVGTFSDLASICETTSLLNVLNLLIERRLSVLPVLNANDCVVNIYGRFDIMNLVNNESYLDLNRTVEQELQSKRPGFEGLYICKSSDSLNTVIDRIVRADVHRLIVVDDEKHLEGVISLSDIIRFLILHHDCEDVQPKIVEDEIQF